MILPRLQGYLIIGAISLVLWVLIIGLWVLIIGLVRSL